MSDTYDHKAIEAKWQERWEQARVAEVDLDRSGDQYYMLMMFPYPSGDRLHVGHGRNYILGDALYRYLRMQGRRALNPMGWDAFGLPAENAAIQRGVHPRDWTLDNIAVMKVQFRAGASSTTGRRRSPPACRTTTGGTSGSSCACSSRASPTARRRRSTGARAASTVLANEQVVDGACERCGTPVEQKELEQWFYRITDYAERLLDDLDGLDGWPERVKTMQRNWIGRSEGAEIDFEVPADCDGETLTVFTTRPDTVHGATFMVLAPEHPLAARLIADHRSAARSQTWIEKVRNTPRIQREAETAKEGRDTGRTAINPATGEEIPIWLADYVLPDYGTGAIMAVPAHDSRDLAVRAPGRAADPPGLPGRRHAGGRDELDEPCSTRARSGASTPGSTAWRTARRRSAPSSTGWRRRASAGRKVTYRLRDWLISRQRYWGTPIPVVYCDDCGIGAGAGGRAAGRAAHRRGVHRPGGQPARALGGVREGEVPACGGAARRETDTMDTFVDSSWYYLRYLSAHDDAQIFDPERAARWAPVDQYIGGIEHAILHLLYARFVCKVLHDFGLVDFDEPFTRLFNQGMITRYAEETGRIEKMSKSRGNTVSPDDLIDAMGADTERVYTLFIGPPEEEVEWNDEAVTGAHRFLKRLWRASRAVADAPATVTGDGDSDLERLRHETIKRVSEDMERFKFNTAVAALMELLERRHQGPRRRDRPPGDRSRRPSTPWSSSCTRSPRTSPRSCGRSAATGRACWRATGPVGTRRSWCATGSPWWSRSTASSGTAWRWTPTLRRRRSRRRHGPARRSSATSTGPRSPA